MFQKKSVLGRLMEKGLQTLNWNVPFSKMVLQDGPIGGSFNHYLFIIEIQIHIQHVNLIQVNNVITVS